MKKRLSLFLALVLLLTGCAQKPVAEVSPAPTAETAAPTTEPTEPPTTEPAPTKKLTAEDVYYRCKFAAGERASAYSTGIQANLRIGAAGVYMRTEISIDQHIIMADEPAQVNVLSHMQYDMMNVEVEQTIQEYYREEGEKLMCYYGVKESGLYGKGDVFLEGYTPYLIIAQYAVYGCPAYVPDNLQLQPETILLEDREVYVLEYTQPASALGFFQTPGADGEALAELDIPVVQYVDAQTFAPVEVTYTVPQMDSDAVRDLLPGIILGEDPEATDIEIQSYVYRLYNMSFEPTEVPPIPEEVLEGIRSADGYTNT